MEIFPRLIFHCFHGFRFIHTLLYKPHSTYTSTNIPIKWLRALLRFGIPRTIYYYTIHFRDRVLCFDGKHYTAPRDTVVWGRFRAVDCCYRWFLVLWSLCACICLCLYILYMQNTFMNQIVKMRYFHFACEALRRFLRKKPTIHSPSITRSRSLRLLQFAR